MKNPTSEMHASQLESILPLAKSPLSGGDFFNLFYRTILAAESLADFETNLFFFMHEVLKQGTLLFYSNVNQDGNKVDFLLQRGSYSNQIASAMLRKTFPTAISLETNESKNSGAEQQIGDALTTNFFSIAPQKSQPTFVSSFQKHSNYIRCGMLLRNQQEIYGVLLYERPLYHPYLNTAFRLQLFQEFLSLALAHRQTVNYAILDQLTNLHRKYYFLNLVEYQLLSKSLGRNYQLLIIDIDHFKNFNDRYGHLAGDHCLSAIAKAIKYSVRTRDFTGRFGGEEFICLIESKSQEIATVAQRIHQTIRKINLKSSADDNIVIPTVSIGIASFQQGMSLTQLIESADKALYQAKESGRNKTVVFQ